MTVASPIKFSFWWVRYCEVLPYTNPDPSALSALTEPDAAGVERALVLGRGVFVEGDRAEFANAFQAGSVQSFVLQVHQHQMVVSSPWERNKINQNDAKTSSL